MEAAGLNPMLAYMQSPGSSPTGQQYQVSNPYEGLAQTYSSAYNVERTAENIAADTRLKEAQKDTQESISKLNDAQKDVVIKTVDKVAEETKNIMSDTKRLDKMFDVLEQQRQNLMKENWNLTEQGNVLRATVDKLKAELPFLSSKSALNEAQKILVNAEAKLKGFDVQSAERADNFGRDAQQYRFLLDLAKLILRR